MKTARQSSAYVRPRPVGNRIKLLAASALLAGAATLLEAEVIDDFNGARKFSLYVQGGMSDYQLLNGQLKISRPRGPGWSTAYYFRTYALTEGRPVQYQVDVISANADDVWVGLGVEFITPQTAWSRGYVLYRQPGRIILEKFWAASDSCLFTDSPIRRVTEPVSLTLTLTRLGESLKLGVKVVLRDTPDQVIFEREVTDGPGSDAAVSGSDIGAPLPGSPTDVCVVCTDSGSSVGAPNELVIDNLVCSEEQAAIALRIQRRNEGELSLAWEGMAIPLEAESVDGPWRPCPEPIMAGAGVCNSTWRSSQPACFLRLVPGRHEVDQVGSFSQWQTASPVPGRVWKPGFGLIAGRGRVRGEGAWNEDSLLTRGLTGWCWYRDCVASVDVVDWDETMQDAAFGILLRVKPERDVWFPGTDGLPAQHYGGLLTFQTTDNPAESALTITGPGDARMAIQRFPALNPEKPYRLRFWAVGTRLTIEVFELGELETPIAACEKTDSRIPEGMSALFGTRSRSAAGKYDVTFDRFMLNGATR